MRMDEEIVSEIDKKILELNSLLDEAQNNSIQIEIDQFPGNILHYTMSGETQIINSSLRFRAKKVTILKTTFVAATGGY